MSDKKRPFFEFFAGVGEKIVVATETATFQPTPIRNRVLVIENEQDMREMVKSALKNAGCDVVEAENAQKAIESVLLGKGQQNVDLIILDISMPKMTGIEAIENLRTKFPTVPLVVMTEQPNVQESAALQKQGVVDYLVKPVSPDKITALVGEAAKKNYIFQGKS